MSEDILKSMESQLSGSDNKGSVVEEPPPILKRWSRLYTVVLINLVLWLLTFYIIRRIFE